MSLLEQNKLRWEKCHVSADKGPAFAKIADRIKANKAVYVDIEKATGVPWWFIGTVHYRESNLDMMTNIANGQSFSKKTTIVPKGRGPFKTFKEAAIDALVNCAPHAARNKDWSAAGALTLLEAYNGLGYSTRGLPSPYIWSGTDQYSKGKFVADHVFDPDVVDVQMGCAGVLKFLGVFNKNVAGPTTGLTTGLTFWAILNNYLHAHPYIAGAIAVSGGLAVYWVVHTIRNRKTI